MGFHDDTPARRQDHAPAEPALAGSRPFRLQRLVILQDRAAGGRKPANGKFTLSPGIRAAALSGWEQDGRCRWQTAHQARRIEFLNGKTTRESGRHDPHLPDVRRPAPRCGEVHIVLRLISNRHIEQPSVEHDQADRPEWFRRPLLRIRGVEDIHGSLVILRMRSSTLRRRVDRLTDQVLCDLVRKVELSAASHARDQRHLRRDRSAPRARD
jgi:hypothetical protein